MQIKHSAMQTVWFLAVVKIVLAATTHSCHSNSLPCVELAIHSVDQGLCRELIQAVDCTHIHGSQPDNTQPVCGTDGVSYPHHCQFAKERCRVILQPNNYINGQQVFSLDIAHDGNCSQTTVAPILATKPPPHTHYCHNDPLPCVELAIHGVDQGLCRELISSVDCANIHGHGVHGDNTQPICGTDGVSYTHHCQFAKERCRVILQPNNLMNGQQVFSLDIAHDGMCNQATVAPIPNCANNSCLDPSISGQAVQQCLQILSLPCTTGVEVCGTDGKTYPHYCELAKAHCKNANITKAHDTPCRVSTQQTTQTTHPSTNAASTSTLSNPTTTDAMQALLQHLLCQNVNSINCSKTLLNVVCGSDGQLYPNECELGKAGCTIPGLRIMPDHNNCQTFA